MDIQYILNNFSFKKVCWVNEPSKGVAWTYIKKGLLVINKPKFLALPFPHQFFIIAHEEGHNICHTKDEMTADLHAYKRFEKMNFDNDSALQTLHLFLDCRKPVHKARLWAQYQRGLENDYNEFGITTAYRPHYETVNEIKIKLKKQLNG
jgi:hypothetical protein